MAQEPANPASPANTPKVEARKRIPMSTPVSKLSVPEIPGYHMHWFRGDAGHIQRAMSAGYEFVDESEVLINSRVLGGNITKTGNTDMGSRVSISAGDGSEADGQPSRLYLMKIKQALWEEDQATLTGEGSHLENIRRGLAGGMLGAEGQSATDQRQIYVDSKRTKLPEFLSRK